jgi:hypothetical protein
VSLIIFIGSLAFWTYRVVIGTKEAFRAARLSSTETTPRLEMTWHKRIFEADQQLVDKLIPIEQRRPGVVEDPNRPSPIIRNKTPAAKHNLVDSQVADIDRQTLESLLAGIPAKSGLLLDDQRPASGNWWNPGLADTWVYIKHRSPTDTGIGGGFFGFRRTNDVTEIRIDYSDVRHQINGLPVESRFLYEGKLSESGLLAGLVPLNASAQYLVAVFELRERNTPGAAPLRENKPKRE